MNAKILLVDDETDLLELLSLNLSNEGFTVQTAQTGADAVAIINTSKPDLVLLDIMLGDISGVQLTAKLKNDPQTADIPIILLTAKDSETDVVVGLTVGADDYVTKPFSTAVLIARIEALLRRAYPKRSAALEQLLRVGSIQIMPEKRQVLVDDKEVYLTGGEYTILLALVKAGGKLLSRKQLKTALGDSAQGQKERIVDVHVAAMRKKLGTARHLVKTIHGQGYRIVI